jgi:sirohydrochlorin cobaltochelatase
MQNSPPESIAVASQSPDLGLLLIGHGTRDPNGLAEFAETVRLVASQVSPAAVEPAFLELASPTIAEGWERLVAHGVRRIVAAPLLLFAAGHARQDIPAALRAAAARHPQLEWRQAEPLGCHPALLELSAQRFQDAVQDAGCAANRCRLIVVGRGSHDPQATGETARYAELLAERVGVCGVRVCFLAMAEPRLPDVLAEAASAGNDSDPIVVQPHLLFQGELLGEIQKRVREWSAAVPTKRWLVTRHLGPAPQVAAAVRERVLRNDQARMTNDQV